MPQFRSFQFVVLAIILTCVTLTQSHNNHTDSSVAPTRAPIIAPPPAPPHAATIDTICSVCECKADNVLCVGKHFDVASLSDTTFLLNTTTISISYNDNITTVQRITSLRGVRTLRLQHNNIHKIAWNAFAALGAQLEELDLSSNVLDFDSFLEAGDNDTVTGLPHLRRLDLSNNRLESLTLASFGPLPAVDTLLLANNGITYLFGPAIAAIAGLRETLHTLDLSANELQTIPPHLLDRLPQLKHLRLHGNRFASLFGELKFAIGLNTLSLGGNPMGNLEDSNVFPPLPKLWNLTLDHLPNMERIGAQALSNLSALTVLSISDNARLNDIHADALSAESSQLVGSRVWPKLREFRLDGNQLTSIPRGLLGTQHWLDDVQLVRLEGNPWKCSCETPTWMQTELLPIIRVKMTRTAMCGENSEMRLRGVSLDYVTEYAANGGCRRELQLETILLMSIVLSLCCLVSGCILRLAAIMRRNRNPDGRGAYKQV